MSINWQMTYLVLVNHLINWMNHLVLLRYFGFIHIQVQALPVMDHLVIPITFNHLQQPLLWSQLMIFHYFLPYFILPRFYHYGFNESIFVFPLPFLQNVDFVLLLSFLKATNLLITNYAHHVSSIYLSLLFLY